MVSDPAGADTPKPLGRMADKLARIQPDPSPVVHLGFDAGRFGSALHGVMANIDSLTAVFESELDAARFGNPTPAPARIRSFRPSGHGPVVPPGSVFTVPSVIGGGNPATNTPPAPPRFKPRGKFIEKQHGNYPTFRRTLDEMTDHDWSVLALEWRKLYPFKFRWTVGIPPGGHSLARALQPFCDDSDGNMVMVLCIDRVTDGTAVARYLNEYGLTSTYEFVIACGWMDEYGLAPEHRDIEPYLRPVFRMEPLWGNVEQMVNDNLGNGDPF